MCIWAWFALWKSSFHFIVVKQLPFIVIISISFSSWVWMSYMNGQSSIHFMFCFSFSSLYSICFFVLLVIKSGQCGSHHFEDSSTILIKYNSIHDNNSQCSNNVQYISLFFSLPDCDYFFFLFFHSLMIIPILLGEAMSSGSLSCNQLK